MDLFDTAHILLSLAGALVYVLVARSVAQRRTSPAATSGMRAFQLWWYGLATLTVAGVIFTLLNLVVGDGHAMAFRVFVLNLLLLMIVAALAGLLYYLLYVYTGSTRVLWPVATYALLEATWLVTIVMQAHPIGYGATCPGGGFCYEHQVQDTATTTWLSLSIFLPILAATVAYFLLYFKVEARPQKQRIARVALALAVWFGTSLVAAFVKIHGAGVDGVVRDLALSQWKYWSLISSLVSLGAALLILWAYHEREPAQPA